MTLLISPFHTHLFFPISICKTMCFISRTQKKLLCRRILTIILINTTITTKNKKDFSYVSIFCFLDRLLSNTCCLSRFSLWNCHDRQIRMIIPPSRVLHNQWLNRMELSQSSINQENIGNTRWWFFFMISHSSCWVEQLKSLSKNNRKIMIIIISCKFILTIPFGKWYSPDETRDCSSSPRSIDMGNIHTLNLIRKTIKHKFLLKKR